MGGPIQIGGQPQASGLPRTWQRPCPGGKHYLNVLEQRNGGDESSDDDEQLRPQPGRVRRCVVNDNVVAAAQAGSSDQVRALLDDGGSSNARDAFEGTAALSWASRHGHTECVELLVYRRAMIDATDQLGWTALMEASAGSHLDAVGVLLAAGANVRLENRNYESALSLAREVQLQVTPLLSALHTGTASALWTPP